MTAILAFLAKFLTGPILQKAVDAYKAKLDAQNTQDAKAVELATQEIAGEIRLEQERTRLLIAEQGWWVTAMIRPLFAFPLILYFWKIIVYDKMLGWGTTDPLTGLVGDWAGLIILAYFGGRSLEKVARVFAKR